MIEGTRVGSGGTIWALNASSGATIWHTAAGGQVIGSVVTADLTGGGYQDVIVPTTVGVQIFDGKSGVLVATLGQSAGLAFQNSPLVTDDANGSIGITIAGYNSSNQGVIEHYEVAGSNGVDRHRDRGVADVPPRPPADRQRRPAVAGRRRCPATRRRVARWATT